jgi:hypothetical protein
VAYGENSFYKSMPWGVDVGLIKPRTPIIGLAFKTNIGGSEKR